MLLNCIINSSQSAYLEDYQMRMKLIQDFFWWKTQGIKASLKQEIDQCILDQNFEWAAKLRDVYNNLEQFTQKQTVILAEFISGIVCKIVHIENKWIIVILHFQNGKLVDVIRTLQWYEEADLEQIVASIEIEFQKELISRKNNSEYYFTKEMKLRVKDWKELEMHFDHYVSSFIASNSWQQDSIANELLKGLQTRYALKSYPYRIECLDISHLSGWWASGGLSCLVGMVPYKKWYRRYKISEGKGGDDYASLQECILRRFKYMKEGMEETDVKGSISKQFTPDLFILDGGKEQLNVVKKLINNQILKGVEEIQFAALGKGDARKSGQKIHGAKEILYVLDDKWVIRGTDFVYDEVDRLLINLRNEAHRFANSYRKKQMQKEIK